ncbi:DUF805 domain-containing protein [Bifidobacterium samirii]|uniref:DUF805 domain-containing protein n=1 Tax=Bifidobacterium samirii TaxID=2306974 RepID=A0A430FHH3_9BIFI|nr:DUF805 domain-containing protein [Bifidobacterium samirii]RSX52260.1 hypothetical protein D2E24_1797 [Bifidobacterium samirii]
MTDPNPFAPQSADDGGDPTNPNNQTTPANQATSADQTNPATPANPFNPIPQPEYGQYTAPGDATASGPAAAGAQPEYGQYAPAQADPSYGNPFAGRQDAGANGPSDGQPAYGQYAAGQVQQPYRQPAADQTQPSYGQPYGQPYEQQNPYPQMPPQGAGGYDPNAAGGQYNPYGQYGAPAYGQYGNPYDGNPYGTAAYGMAAPPLDKPYYGCPLPEAFLRFWKKYATFSGRASRSEFWWWMLCAVVINFLLGMIEGDSSLLTTIWSIATIVPTIALGVRRLHDTNRRGTFLAVYYVVMVLALFFIMIFGGVALVGAIGAMGYGDGATSMLGGSLVLMAICGLVSLGFGIAYIVLMAQRSDPAGVRFDKDQQPYQGYAGGYAGGYPQNSPQGGAYPDGGYQQTGYPTSAPTYGTGYPTTGQNNSQPTAQTPDAGNSQTGYNG